MRKFPFQWFFIAVALAAVLYLFGPWREEATGEAARPVLRIATEGAYAPFNYVDASGQLAGFDIEIGRTLCAQMQVECAFQAVAWDGLIPGLLENRYDVILASMLITPERRAQVAFTQPYYRTPSRFAAHKDFKIADVSPKAMADMTLGAQRGTVQAAYLAAHYQDFRLYDTVDEALLDLAAKRVIAVLGEQVHFHGWLASDAGACCELVGPELRDPAAFGEGTGIAVRLQDQELLAKLDAALLAIKADGRYGAINARYFPFSIE